MFVLVLLGIGASALGMALLYVPGGDASRVYYGTDTRAAALLAGAALAFVVGSWRLAGAKNWAPKAFTLVGLASLALLLGAAVWLDESQPLLYRGGFLAVSLCSVLAILAATRPNLFARALSVTPLRWVGIRSYGIYLWHWPVYMLVWPNEPTLGELAGQITAVVLIAAASYALPEKPIREGLLSRTWRRLRDWSELSAGARRTAIFSGAASAAVLFALIAVSLQATAPKKPAYFELGHVRLRSGIIASDVGSVVREPTLMGRVQTAISALTTQPRACPYQFQPPAGSVVSVSSAPYGPDCPQPLLLFQAPEALKGVDSGRLEVNQPPAGPADSGSNADAGEEPEEQAVVSTPATATPTTPAATQQPESVLVEPTQTPSPVSSPTSAPAEPSTTAVPPGATPAAGGAPVQTQRPSVTAIGDSVMLGAAYALAGSIPGIDLDAAVGRQASAAIALLQERAAAGQLGQVVVMQIGNNGTLTASQFDQIMQIVGPSRQAVFLSLHVPRAWQDSNNAVIQAGVSRYANARLIDWYDAGTQHPELLNSDGIHLTPAGASYYASLVVAAIGG